MLPGVATLAAIVVFVAAGNWQRGRMHQKEAWGEQLAAAEAAPPVPLPRDVPDWSAWRFRAVELAGTFDAQRQFLLDNKVQRGRVGYHVVTPIVLDDGRAVLVDRGWVPGGATRAEVPAVPVPAGRVVLSGRLNLPPQGYVELAATAPERGVWQNLDPARFAAATGLAVLPVVVEATQGAGEGFVREWPRPEVGTEKHRIYMMQWYAFAAMAAGLWLWFTFRRRGAPR
ncbi:MAG TPA: SURF1 family protein [Casimicrobiaceae bacterium]|nr:SURF1 family protein [Casimicrobiaceae bacterium]